MNREVFATALLSIALVFGAVVTAPTATAACVEVDPHDPSITVDPERCPPGYGWKPDA